jgi:hypothetical protein
VSGGEDHESQGTGGDDGGFQVCFHGFVGLNFSKNPKKTSLSLYSCGRDFCNEMVKSVTFVKGMDPGSHLYGMDVISRQGRGGRKGWKYFSWRPSREPKREGPTPPRPTKEA